MKFLLIFKFVALLPIIIVSSQACDSIWESHVIEHGWLSLHINVFSLQTCSPLQANSHGPGSVHWHIGLVVLQNTLDEIPISNIPNTNIIKYNIILYEDMVH